ncbi:hypothetical protein HX001_16790 [Empedobacter brevis]|uniref:Uncharacterized protein n=1 Tax=Empedobacter brevis TaxID=247 RepID=A0AAJ1QHI5_9FLAO|nr:hypothetical protein [Empedobacter brevis]MDM1074143.1 hypothetical protein [Empedobacter brevis]QHC85826.1 hypothetical protein AS589_14055 [Empedobacter brevis]
MNISIEYLEDICDSNILPLELQKVVEVILVSANDWPRQVDSLTEFENEIFNLTKIDNNKETLNYYISSLNILENAWVVESLSQLLEIYNYYNYKESLHSIFKDIAQKLSSYN